jgi:transcriptional regulator with XRE-family HTH domain
VTLGDHLRARRMELGVSQERVAKQLGVGLASISN